MNWSAKILEKSEVDAENKMTYKFVVIGDDVERITLSETNTPADIQQSVAERVRAFGGAWELAASLPVVGETIEVVMDA